MKVVCVVGGNWPKPPHPSLLLHTKKRSVLLAVTRKMELIWVAIICPEISQLSPRLPSSSFDRYKLCDYKHQ
jgi:hypothetical protein